MKPYYQDDYVTLYNGDCREIIPRLDIRFDLLLTDPPYGIGYKPQKHNSKKSMADRNSCATDKLSGDTGKLDFDPTYIYDKFKDINQVWWGANNYADALPRSRGWLVWYKADGMERTDFSHAELAWTSLNMPIRGKNFLWMGMCKSIRHKRAQHPTQKPIEIMTWCLSFFPECKTILDPFAGSGTTGVAAKELNRKCVLIELEEKYCEIAARRLSQEVFNFEEVK